MYDEQPHKCTELCRSMVMNYILEIENWQKLHSLEA